MSIIARDVIDIFPAASSLPGETVIAAINTAGIITTERLSACSYSQNLKDEIQKYIAAHYLYTNTQNGGLARKRVGMTEEEYVTTSTEDRGLSKTPFGEQALSLDFEGCLSSLAVKTLRARFRVV